MHPVAELISRNAHRLSESHPVSWVNPPGDARWEDLPGASAARLFSQDFGAATTLRAAGAAAEFVDFPLLPGLDQQHVILTLPHGKAALGMMLHCLASQLGRHGRLWLAGENRAGIKSAKSHLARHFERVEKLDSARHCVLFEANDAKAAPAFTADHYRQEHEIAAGDARVCVVSWPGVFAHGRLDDGTALLLDAIDGIDIAGRVLDFGAGCGVIGTCLGMRYPGIDLELVDNDAMALRSAKATLQANRVDGTVIASDGLSRVEGVFDLVVSNPPFHDGHATRTDKSMRLLTDVRNFLAPGGQLLLVVNRHLPYRQWLDGTFTDHRVLAFDNRFQVLLAGTPGV